jgi:hypothetical protein
MLVYGDHRRSASPHELVASLHAKALARPTGEAAVRAWATMLLIETGELIQGLLDAGDGSAGQALASHDAAYPTLALAAANLYLAAEPAIVEPAIEHARRRFAEILDGWQERRLPNVVEIRVPEGYAYYGVYPVLYARAAKTLIQRGAEWIVIGIRSIGTSLAAVVAATLATDSLHFVRPGGHPFTRTLTMPPELGAALRASPSSHFAIVDEGPGLSGSTFGAVADCLEDHGVSSERLHFFPSHGAELGHHASERHRERWTHAHRCHCAFESFFDGDRLRKTVFGGLEGEIREISAGRWRTELYPNSESWPPVHLGLERRKYLLRGEGCARVAKFVGLGRYGIAQARRAFFFHERGFIPQPIDYRDGFLVSNWHEEAVPLDRAAPAVREALLPRLFDYLAFLHELRAKSDGASIDALLNMAIINASEALGGEAGVRIEARWRSRLGSLADACLPVASDNRLHPWEWLALPGGLLKTDALEHHADHGLIGCQDLAWDLAGAKIEHAMTIEEYDDLLYRLGRASLYRSHPEKEALFTCCYLAYQIGYYTLSADAAGSFGDLTERRRSLARRNFYTVRLVELLDRPA